MDKLYLLCSAALVVLIVFLAANIFTHVRMGSTGYFTATPTGVADINVSVSQAVSILIDAGSAINFGSLYPSDSNSTESGTGVILENNGTYDVNITASSDAFFTSTNIPSWAVSSLTCKAAAYTGGSAVFFQTTYVDCYDTAVPKIVGCLSYTDLIDKTRVDMNLTVPTDEAAGLKQGQVTFTASSC